MRLNIKVIPNARKSFLKQEGENYKAYVHAPALEGRANEALIELLVENFKVKKGQIEIIKGLKSNRKTIKIMPISQPLT